MTELELNEARRLAEFSTGPLTMMKGEDGTFHLVAPDGTTKIFTALEDISTLTFHAKARELVLNLVNEVEALQKEKANTLTLIE